MFLCQLPTPSVTMFRYANLDMPATNKVDLYQTTGYANVHWHLKSFFAFWQDVNKSWFSFKTCLEWQTKLPKSFQRMPLEVRTKLTSDGLPIPYHMLDLVLLALLRTYWHFILAKFSNGNSKQTDCSKHRFRNILTF